MKKVRVLYEFKAEDSNELTTYVGEELTVINPSVFDGWMQCQNRNGQQGIVPTTYVESINDSDDDIPPPPSESTYGFGQNAPSWNIPAPGSSYVNQNSYVNQYNTQTFNSTSNSSNYNQNSQNYNIPSSKGNNQSYDDDSFDSDEEPSVNTSATTGMNNSSNFYANNNNNQSRSSVSSGIVNPGNSTGTIKVKQKNSYGLEVFLLHGPVKKVLDSDKFSSIVLNEMRQSVWKRVSPPYQIQILGYHSDKKYHGVKKFTSYEIQAKIFPQKVRRRYNHFDWLHERLVEKYPNICIPPLPGKAVTGNFEDEFIAKRKAQLELWLNRMASHPVVGQSEVFVHFLQCDEASSKWKAGKRKAEKDEYRAAQWFCTLTVPGESVDSPNGIKEKVDKFSKACVNLDNSVKNVVSSLDKIAGINNSMLRKEYVGLGKRFDDLGIALNNESLDASNNHELTDALITTGNTYTQIGNMFGEQPKTDIGPLLDRFQLYRGIIQQMPDIVQFEKQSIQTYEEFQNRPEKLEGRSLMEIAPRREIISHVTFAEMNLFNKDKVDDFNQYMKTFLQQQIAFYSEITECLKRAYATFEKIPSNTSPTNNFNSSFRR
ncbi:unnamed protein product [Brachionus calyciflorus]|uniref:Sorting nexin n=1 Tax=Brachionus calyciflorus TaxID=104777 RepID=A0A813MVH7_9BILA|nr:unnamed protein product [Brachionus calyciflorus]